MRIAIPVIFMFFILSSCNNDKKEQDKLYEEVMDIHDEVMPLMYPLKKMAKDINTKAELLLKDSVNIDSLHLNTLRITSNNISKANDSMMDWMHQFKQIEEGTPHGEVIQYLMDQKQKISKVRDDMMAAKKEGEKYVSVNN